MIGDLVAVQQCNHMQSLNDTAIDGGHLLIYLSYLSSLLLPLWRVLSNSHFRFKDLVTMCLPACKVAANVPEGQEGKWSHIPSKQCLKQVRNQAPISSLSPSSYHPASKLSRIANASWTIRDIRVFPPHFKGISQGRAFCGWIKHCGTKPVVHTRTAHHAIFKCSLKTASKAISDTLSRDSRPLLQTMCSSQDGGKELHL